MPDATPGHDLIVIGASAGGVDALLPIVRGLPADLSATVCIVLHVPANTRSRLPEILTRAGKLPAVHARDGDRLERGHIYVAPPDLHLLVRRDHVRVVRGPRENRSRPAVDPLFRSAALAYGPRVVGIILSGALSDGVAGLLAIKRRGGIAVVQSPETALVPMMPESALAYVAVDYCLPAKEIAPLLVRLTADPTPEDGAFPVPPEMEQEARMPEIDQAEAENINPPGMLTGIICPECRGPLWETEDGTLVRYRCRQGHAFTGESVLDGQAEAVEQALWVALETLTESALVAHRLAEQAHVRGHRLLAQRFERRAAETNARVQVIRRVLDANGATISDPTGEPEELPPAAGAL